MTNYSRSVLKSNGLCHSKNLPVKFGFSPKIVPAYIVKKLPSQCCSKPLLIPFFNLSHKWPTFAFTPKAGTHSAFGERSHTAAYTPKQGRFGWGRYYYPRSISHVSETLRGQVSERQTLPLLGLGRVCSRRVQRACGTAMCLCASLFRRRRGPAGSRDPIAVSLTALMGFTVLLVHDNSTQRTYLLFHTLVCSMRLATRCRSFALSTVSICR